MASKKQIIKVQVTDLVAADSLHPNPWNTNGMTPENEVKLEESLKRFGMFRPLVVRTLEDGSLEILGGQHRWEVGKRLGMENMPVFNVGVIDDVKAKEIGLVDNGRYGQDDTLALGDLLKELGQTDNLTEFLPYTDLELESIFSASSISLDDLNIDSDAELPPLPSMPAPQTHQIMRFKIPVEDIAWVQSLVEMTMRSQNFTSDDSLTNAGNGLVHILKSLK